MPNDINEGDTRATVQTPVKPTVGTTTRVSRHEATEPVIIAANPTPPWLKYILTAVLALSVLGVTLFAVIHQSPVKPPSDPADCTDPVSENRLRDAVRTNPNDYQSLVQLGSYSYSCTKDFASAISAYSQAVAIADNAANKISQDDWMQAHMSLGLSYLSNNGSDKVAAQANAVKASKEFQTILARQPDNPNALLGMGAAVYGLDPTQPDRALSYWQKVIQQSPGSDAAQKAQQFIDFLNKPVTSNLKTTSTAGR